MSLRFIDSFDHYASGDLAEKYHYADSGALVAAAYGRRGTAGLRLDSPEQYVSLTLDAQARWTVGFAFRYERVFFLSTPGILFDLANTSTSQLQIVITPEGFVVARLGSGTVLGQSTQALHSTVFYYLETSVLVHASAGEVRVRVDGVEWLHLTGIDTENTAGVLPNQVRLGSVDSFGLRNLRIDDVYICDGQGSGTFTTFLGDCRVDALYPNADGTYTAWAPSSGTSHSALVDESPPNDETDYVSATTGGARDSYQLMPLPFMPNPEVLAVQACISARKEDVDEILIKPLLVSGAATSVASAAHELNASYKYALDLWTADPNGGGAWTAAAINSLQVGVERA